MTQKNPLNRLSNFLKYFLPPRLGLVTLIACCFFNLGLIADDSDFPSVSEAELDAILLQSEDEEVQALYELHLTLPPTSCQ